VEEPEAVTQPTLSAAAMFFPVLIFQVYSGRINVIGRKKKKKPHTEKEKELRDT